MTTSAPDTARGQPARDVVMRNLASLFPDEDRDQLNLLQGALQVAVRGFTADELEQVEAYLRTMKNAVACDKPRVELMTEVLNLRRWELARAELDEPTYIGARASLFAWARHPPEFRSGPR